MSGLWDLSSFDLVLALACLAIPCAVIGWLVRARRRDQALIRRLELDHATDERMRGLLETAPDAMVAVDEHGRIVFVNAETERMFGTPRAQLLGGALDDLLPERFRASHAAHRTSYFASAASRGAASIGRELVALRSDGSEFPVEIRLSPIRTTDGLVVSSAIRDVTERKRADRALLRAKEVAETANAELEAFSYSVAHDLRAPLRGISGFSTNLLEDYGDKLDGDAQRKLHRIVAGAERMAEIIDALLGLARLTRTEPRRQRVDLGQLGRSVIGQLRASDPEREVEFVAADGLVGQGDPQLLRVLVENLLGNAWKFTRNQPRARVELGRESMTGSEIYYVRDNGAGFNMALADKLFVPFRRLHSATEFDGTGIGLATVQRIVHRHGGRIWAEATETQGATFRFTLSSDAPPGAAVRGP